MRIIQAIDASGWGGAENVVVSLSNGLSRRGHEVEVWVRRNSLLCDELEKSVVVREVPFLNDGDPMTVFLFAKALRSYDVLHVHLGKASILSGFANAFRRKRFSNKLFCHMHSFHKPKHYRNQKQIICVSKAVEDYVKENMPWVQKTWVVHNGIDLLKAQSAEPLVPRNADRVRVGLLASFKEGKGHEDLIKAVSLLLKSDLPVELVLGGEGPLFPDMVALASELKISDRVNFMGFVPPEKVFGFWKSVDVACFPSYVEGFSMSVVEAMASGVPVVAYNYQGATEALGEGAAFVPVGDIATLARSLKMIIEDHKLRKDLAAISLQKSKGYSVEAMVDGILEVYRSTH